MNRSILILSLLVLFCTMAYSQTIVSTEPQNKTALLEYFGGIYCGYCPDGDDIAMAIKESYGDQVAVINIQSGYFAIPNGDHPDLRSDWGYALDQLSGNGQLYPAGTVNRHHFPGYELVSPGTTAMGRNYWANATQQIINQPSPVNLALTAELDPVNNTINIYLETYYTSNCFSDTNYLHVALIQNSVEAPQLLEDSTFDQDYLHHYLLRDFITPQWGTPIASTTAGSLESWNLSYQLPANFRDVMVDINQLEIVAFVTVDQQEIMSAASNPVIINEPFHDVDVNLWAANLNQNICDDEIQPNLIIRNDGTETLSDLTIEYAANNGPLHYYEWSGSLDSYQATNIILPSIYFEAEYGITNTLQVQISTSSSLSEDANLSNNIIHTQIEDVPNAPTPTITLELKTDDYGHETYWEILDSDGNLVVAGGNHNVGANGGGQQTATASDPGAYLSNALIVETIELPGFDCYEFRILDDFSDGICCNYGVGYYRIKDENGNVLFFGGHFDTEKKDPFRINAAVTSLDSEEVSEFSVYPNPVTTDFVKIQFDTAHSGQANIALFNASGQLVLNLGQKQLNSGHNNWDISTHNLPNGMYILQCQIEEKIFTEKIIVLRN